MHAQVGSEGDAADEEQKRVERVQSKHGDWNGESVHDGSSDQVDERQHGEDGDEHDVVDDGRVAGEGIVDDVSSQREDEEGHEELSKRRVSGCARKYDR